MKRGTTASPGAAERADGRSSPPVAAQGALWNTATEWGTAAKAFHWTMAALVLVQIGLGLAAVAWTLSPMKLDLYVWHKSTGIALLALIALRLAWRTINPTPALPAAMSRHERMAARAVHGLLYLLLILLPVTGWIVNSAANIPLRLFWLVPLPSVVAPDELLALAVARVHLALFVLLALLLAAHVGAALRHHFVLHDGIMARMLPRRRSAP